MTKKYLIAKIEYKEFEKFIIPDKKIILDEVDDNSIFDTLQEAEFEIKNKIEKYKDKSWQFSIVPLYY